MIYIEEKVTVKVPGLTSLFLTVTDKLEVKRAIENLDCFYYHRKTHEYEIPISYLSKLFTNLILYDDIKLKVLDDEDKKNTQYELEDLNVTLYEYQKEGVQFGLNNNKWLLLDEVGLGKTLQIISLANELKRRNLIEHCLIVCGINNLKFNWLKEIKKHSNLSCTILGQRINKKGRLTIGDMKDRINMLLNPIEEFFIITNIETLRDDRIIEALNSQINKIEMIALDEAHCIKTPNTHQSQNFLSLQATYKIAMTGTLLLNNPLDAYIPLKWLDLERSTYTLFKDHYCVFSPKNKNIVIKYKNLDILKNQIEHYSLRRKKQDKLDLPKQTIISEYIEMDLKQEKLYKDVTLGIKEEVDKVKLTNNLRSLIVRLRQITAYPNMITKSDIPSSKIQRAISLTEEILAQNEKVVIFSTFKEPLKELYRQLQKYGCVLCTGDNKDEEVSAFIDKFQNEDDYKIFLATWSKCGTGITLTAATYLIFIDTPYTWGAFEQCCARINRIGTTQPTFVYVLMNKGTFDIHIQELLMKKELLSSYVIDDDIPKELLDQLKKYILEFN